MHCINASYFYSPPPLHVNSNKRNIFATNKTKTPLFLTFTATKLYLYFYVTPNIHLETYADHLFFRPVLLINNFRTQL